MKTTKSQRELINTANIVIHTQNLFRELGNRRVVHAHMHDGMACVMDLYSGERHPLIGTWRNANGHTVTFDVPTANDVADEMTKSDLTMQQAINKLQ